MRKVIVACFVLLMVTGMSMTTKDSKKKTLPVKYAWESISDFKTLKASIDKDLEAAGEMIPYEGEIKAKFEKLYTLYIFESGSASTKNEASPALSILPCWACKCNHCFCFIYLGCGLIPPTCGPKYCTCCHGYWGSETYVGTCARCSV
jgi:hypothetical protein